MNNPSTCTPEAQAPLPREQDAPAGVRPTGPAQSRGRRMLHALVLPWRNVLMGGVLFVVAAGVSVGYLRTVAYTPHFGSNWFAPSVMIVEGFGMVNPDLSHAPELSAFLGQKKPTWNPENERASLTSGPLHWFQRDHPNLIYAVAACWRLFGYSWKSLIPLHALLFAVSVVLAFGICRLAMPGPLAVAAALLFMLSPAHLQMIPELRDYSKVPFILATVWACGYLVREARPRRRVLAVAGALGAGVGLGLGFRLDMTICILPAILTLLFFTGGGWKRRLILGPAAALVFALALAVTGKPSLDNMRKNGTMASHNIGGGLYWRFDEAMGLQTSYYRLLNHFNDAYIYETSSSYYRRTYDANAAVPWFKPAYYDAGEKYLRTYARHFPSDVLFRAWGSLLRTMESSPADTQREYGTNPFLVHCAAWLAGPMKLVCNAGRYFALAALLILAAHRFSWGLFALGALLYLGGYPSLQYMPRHYFHLSLAPWWCLGFLFSQLLFLLGMLFNAAQRQQLRARLTRPRPCFAPFLRVLGLVSLAVLCMGLPMLAARVYQKSAVRSYVSALAGAEREPVAVREETIPKGNQVLLHCETLFEDSGPALSKVGAAAAYLVAEFSGPPQRLDMGLRYSAVSSFQDFSLTMPVQTFGAGPESITRVFFPVYQRVQPANSRRQFIGVTLPQAQRGLLRGLYRVKNADSFPLWPSLFLSPHWRDEAPVLTLPWTSSPYPPLLKDTPRAP